MNAILAEFDIPYTMIKEYEEVNFQNYELAIVVGAYEEVDPNNLKIEQS